VPFDTEAILQSVRKTGRLLVVHEDRVFSSLGREIQGTVIEATQGEPIVTRVLGQDPVPGIPQNVSLEDRLAVNPDKVYDAAKALLEAKLASSGERGAPAATRTAPSVLWIPNRNFVS
jgi:2-oxoisovalerate dehydrogenase E1 component